MNSTSLNRLLAMMMFSLLLTLVVSAASASEYTIWQPGRALIEGKLVPSTGDGKIYGGSNADITQYPWQVSLQFSTGSHTCGGSIISPTWVLCAAHCTQSTGYRIRAGSTMRTSGGVLRTIIRIINHPNYNDGSGTFSNDISLLELSEPLVFSDTIQPISLPPLNMDFAGSRCFLSGWGRTCDGCALPTTLQHIQMLVIPNSECATRMSSVTGVQMLSSHICVYSDNNLESSCSGDSGGPMTCYVGNTPYLAGATSWGISSNNNCLPRFPSVYTRVSSFDSWIRANVPL